MAVKLKKTKIYDIPTIPPEDCRPGRCNLCGADRTRQLTIHNGFPLVECRECGFVYVNPRPHAKALERFYTDYFVEGAETVPLWEKEFNDLYTEIRGVIDIRCPQKGRILDVGCSFGFFLKVMSQSGWEVHGIDSSAYAVEYARNVLHLPHIEQGPFEDSEYPEGHFDVINMSYVLEHVIDPTDFLQKLHRILKEGGLLVNRVPYSRPLIPFFKLLGRPTFEAPMHLSDFSPRTMKKFLEKTGFRENEVFISKPRRTSDLFNRIATSSLTALGRGLFKLTRGRYVFPLTGAFVTLSRK